jgi:hypothetical protein
VIYGENNMKQTINISLLLILFLMGLVGCTNIETRVQYTKDMSIAESLNLKENWQPMQENDILSKDYNIAERALNKAVNEKNKDFIKLGLKSTILAIRLKTVEAINKIADYAFVTNLIDALQENQGIIDGGSEVKIQQEDLNTAIIQGLERLTKLKFKVSKQLTAIEIEDIIKKSNNFLDEQKKIIEKKAIKTKKLNKKSIK